MKVLWIIQGREVYGEKRAIVSLVKGVRDSGWEVEVVSTGRGGCSEELERAGVKCVYLEMEGRLGLHLARGKVGRAWQGLLLFKHQFRLGRVMRRAIRESGADVVHTLNKNVLPAVGWAAKKEGKVCFWEMATVLGSGYRFDLNRRLHRVLCRWLGIVPLANSRYTGGTLAARGFGVEVMYLGVDPVRFDGGRRFGVSRSGLGILEDATVFAIVARVDPSKGQRIFLEAMLRVGEAEGVHLLLVGCERGSEEAGRVMEAARAGRGGDAEGRVHMVERTEEPEAYLAIADVAVNALVGAEAFGLSVVEAMMMGKPVLVHALGGPAETVVDGQTGWHVGEATVEGFAAGIRRAMGDRRRWGEMGAAARRRAVEKFSLEAQVRRYRELVAKGMEDSIPPIVEG